MSNNLMTLEEFNSIRAGEVFRSVTTNQHKDTEWNNPLLTFVCVKGNHNDWAIYYHYADKGISFIREQGTKLTTDSRIQYILPCTDEVLKCYRY